MYFNKTWSGRLKNCAECKNNMFLLLNDAKLQMHIRLKIMYITTKVCKPSIHLILYLTNYCTKLNLIVTLD